MELAFTTFYYSSHSGLVGGFGIGNKLPRFFRIKTFNIPHITIITFFPIIFLFKVQEVNVNEACIR